MGKEEESKSFTDVFLSRYPRNNKGGFDTKPEDFSAVDRISEYFKEVSAGEARTIQQTSKMRFIG